MAFLQLSFDILEDVMKWYPYDNVYITDMDQEMKRYQRNDIGDSGRVSLIPLKHRAGFANMFSICHVNFVGVCADCHKTYTVLWSQIGLSESGNRLLCMALMDPSTISSDIFSCFVEVLPTHEVTMGTFVASVVLEFTPRTPSELFEGIVK